MKNWRRYELLLPLKFHNGDRVPKALLAETVQELEDRFGAVSSETQIIHGRWQSGGQAFRDDLIRIYVDVEDSKEARFLYRFQRPRQNTLWPTRHLVDKSHD